jgi:hypothetical protein
MSQNIGINGMIRMHKEEFHDDTFHEYKKASALRNTACHNFGHKILVLFGALSAVVHRKAYTYLYVESNDFECDNDHLHNITENHGNSEEERTNLKA